MLYLHQTLLLWVIAAAVLGLIVGWLSCRRQPRLEGLGWVLWAVVAFLVGLMILVLMWFSGRTALWFETGMMFFFWYIFGCCVGCVLRNFLNPLPLAGATATAVTKLTTFPDAAPAAPTPVAAMPVMAATGPAMVRPYQWQAARDAASVTLTGYVPSDEARGRVVSAAKTALAPASVVDKLQLGSGAPGGLEGMASSAFGHLSKLDKGIASLIDSKYTLTGVAGTRPNYDAVMSTVKTLPMGYSLAKVDIVAPPAPPKPVAVAKPVAAAKPVAKPKPAAAPVAVKAPEPKAAPKIAGEDKVPGKRPAGLAAPRGGKADDLKRIRGIGKQNEGRLHGLGIWHFDQISGWNAQESLWVGSYLAFPGRIEREEWIKQAKVLATGKDTEFSRRVAKGMVATSKDDGTLGNKNVAVVKPVRAVAGKAPAKVANPAAAKSPVAKSPAAKSPAAKPKK